MTDQSQTILNNRYRLLSRLGAGGMANVWKAEDMSLGRLVAVKILHEALTADPAFLHRFEREARSAANLSHPNIVTVHDVGQDGDTYYIVMEYVDGEDLKSLVRREAPLSVDRALDLAIQICAGVGYAHRAGFVHCDVKPQNVLVTRDGRIKVADFGIARALSSSTISSTQSDTVWGSPHYFSPEQATGETPTPASDVYAVGVVLFEMLTARLPFEAENPTALALMHLRDAPPLLTQYNPQVPVALEQIVLKILSKEPAARYRTADQLGRILESYRYQGRQSTQAQPPVEMLPPAGVTLSAAPQPAARPYAPPAVQPGARVQQVQPPTMSMAQPAGPAAVETDEYDDQSEGVDWLGIMLALLALIAVCGLIPLWWIVYLRLTGGTPPTPTPLPPTPIPAALAALGLRFIQ